MAADAGNPLAVSALRERKGREEKPFALMAKDMEGVRQFAHVRPEEETLLTSHLRPIVLLEKRARSAIVDGVAPENRYFGVMLPYTPLHYILFEHGFSALVMTSANQSEEPIVIDNGEAFERLSGMADYFLVHDRGIYLRCDDSIARVVSGQPRIIRRSRGYIPVPVFLKHPMPQILACGGELKNTICLTKERHAFLSQHIGDMENKAAYDFFQMTIRHMKKILHIRPGILAHDLHPDYLSTRYAMEQEDLRKIPVQHHHAHIVSCMGEHRIGGPVIGLAFDGAGYGADGHIWGGEALLADTGSFKRAAHLSYLPMPGGTAAIRQPWRMAVSCLYEIVGEDIRNVNAFLPQKVDAQKAEFIADMIQKKINTPLTSSLGRLFDAVSAMVGLGHTVSFEGQAAMALEMAADQNHALDGREGTYDFKWTGNDVRIIHLKPMLRGIVDDLKMGVHASVISTRFHSTLIRLFSELCRDIRGQTDIDRVVLSGGVFQNATLLGGLIRYLEKDGFTVFSHSAVPTNDGGLSLGQAIVAAEIANNS
jgi:hydrogenase maturation protein HypF